MDQVGELHFALKKKKTKNKPNGKCWYENFLDSIVVIDTYI